MNNNDNDVPPLPQGINIPIVNEAIGYQELQGVIGQQINEHNLAKDASGASEGKHSD
jgi:hypothetical protein